MRAFISYSVHDKHLGGVTKRVLEDLSVECFLAHEDIQVSEEWKSRILQELRDTDIFVVLISEKFKKSDWCSQEVGFIASRNDVLIIPLRLDQTVPYGFISHLQGQFVSDESKIAEIIEDALYRKRPHEMIPVQIERVRSASSFRGGEAAVQPFIPYFPIFSKNEIESFVKAVVENSQVWNASLCRSEYIPKFVSVNGNRISAPLRKELKKKFEKLVFPKSI